MSDQLYYLMSMLPPLPELGHAPPITMEELLSTVRLETVEVARTLAEAFNVMALAGQAAEKKRKQGHSYQETPGAHSVAQDLPPAMAWLLSQAAGDEDVWLTELWRESFRYLERTGEDIGSSLLVGWAEWESSLREGLMNARRKSVGVSAAGGEASNLAAARHSGLITEWAAATDPLAGERLLDEARIRFIDAGSAGYSFDIDELVAYFLKLGLLLRHAALDREAGAGIIREVTAL